MAKTRIFPFVLFFVGLAFLGGALFSWFDNLTATEPVGLGKWIFDVLELLIGAGAGIGGWLSLRKSGKSESSPRITNTAENLQSAVGENINQRQAGRDFYERVDKIEVHEAPKLEPPVLRSLHQLPQPPADFTGRDTLIALLLEDLNSHKGATISGLTGMGGIGKTALGLVIAHKIVGQYPDAQIFLDLKGTTAPLSTTDIARYVILSFESNADLRAFNESNLLVAYQSVLHEKKALLFFDNARSAQQIAPLCPPETCTMLVTSRWTFPVAGLKIHRVGVFRDNEAIAFLLELCPRIDEKAAELAKICGFLPLALRIAGSFLQVNSGWSIEKYLTQLANRKDRLESLRQSRQQAELTAEPDLLATFELSYNQLSEADQKRWRMLGVFPASLSSIAAQAMWGLDEDETAKLLGLLGRYSLIEFAENAGRYFLHDLLADYALSMIDGGEEQEARLKHSSHYKDVLSAADDLYLEGGEKTLLGLRLFDVEWENIRSGQAWLVSQMNTNPVFSKLIAAYPDAGAYVLSVRQHPRQKIEWLSAAILAAREIGDRRGEGNALGNLGLAYAALGDARKAIEFYEQQLVIVREIGDRRGEAFGSWNLGLEYEKAGELDKAIFAMQICVDFEREIAHPDAEKDAARIEEIRQKLKEGRGGG